MTNEWIEHDGRGAPDLPSGKLVFVRTADGWQDTHAKAWNFWGGGTGQPLGWWSSSPVEGFEGDFVEQNVIVAYRVSP